MTGAGFASGPLKSRANLAQCRCMMDKSLDQEPCMPVIMISLPISSAWPISTSKLSTSKSETRGSFAAPGSARNPNFGSRWNHLGDDIDWLSRQIRQDPCLIGLGSRDGHREPSPLFIQARALPLLVCCRHGQRGHWLGAADNKIFRSPIIRALSHVDHESDTQTDKPIAPSHSTCFNLLSDDARTAP